MNKDSKKKGVLLFVIAFFAFIVLLILLVGRCGFSVTRLPVVDTVEEINSDTIENVKTDEIKEVHGETTIDEDETTQIFIETTSVQSVTEEVTAIKTTEESQIIGLDDNVITTVSPTTLTEAYNQTTAEEDITTEHTHNFDVTITFVSHPEEGHYEEVCVTDGYNEEIYETYNKYCYQCGVVMDDWSFEQLLDHSAIHGSFGTYTKVVDTIWHEPVYETIWVVDKEAYDEEVIVEQCKECGYVK